MKILTHSLLFFLIFLPFVSLKKAGYHPSGITVCHSDLPKSMTEFVKDSEFVKMHPAPLPLKFNGLGEEIRFDSPDGKQAHGYFIRAKKKSDKWLFVYQEWWGLNDYIRSESDKFYTDLKGEINVLALDMYDGKVASDASEAGKLMQGANQERLDNIIKGGYQFAGKTAKVASIGWCFGGGLSLKSALTGKTQNVGSVMYYGMPVDDIEQLKTLSSDVLGLFATENWISKDVVENFAANMKKANKKLTYKIFDAVHGFANPSNANHDREATKEAYDLALNYLKEKYSI